MGGVIRLETLAPYQGGHMQQVPKHVQEIRDNTLTLGVFDSSDRWSG